MRESWRRCYLEVGISTGIDDTLIYNTYSISVVYASTISLIARTKLPTKKGCKSEPKYNTSFKLKLKPYQTNLNGLGIKHSPVDKTPSTTSDSSFPLWPMSAPSLHLGAQAS